MTLQDILAEYRIEVIRMQAVRGPRQTHARQTLDKLFQEHGPDHLRDVLTTIAETENNGMALVAPIITAVSVVLRAHTDWWERDASRWLDVMDRLDLTRLHRIAKGNLRAAPAADAIATMLYLELEAAFGEERPDLFDSGGPIDTLRNAGG